MKTLGIIIGVVVLYVILVTMESFGNVYVVIYATRDGKTGHAGLAIDNYNIIVNDKGTDTVATGTVKYYDLWPSNDDFGLFSYSKPQKALYYTLPNAIWSQPLSVDFLTRSGIPHREGYPPDAILQIRTTATADFGLTSFIHEVIESKQIFNPRFYNCTDFVSEAVAFVTGKKFRAKEFIPFSFTSTPNKLYKKLIQLEDVESLKTPQHSIRRSFVRERVLKRKRTSNPFQTEPVQIAAGQTI